MSLQIHLGLAPRKLFARLTTAALSAPIPYLCHDLRKQGTFFSPPPSSFLGMAMSARAIEPSLWCRAHGPCEFESQEKACIGCIPARESPSSPTPSEARPFLFFPLLSAVKKTASEAKAKAKARAKARPSLPLKRKGKKVEGGRKRSQISCCS